MAPPAAGSSATQPVVFFDGECPLCNRSVAFLARHDVQGKLLFAHLQGSHARSNLAPDTVSVARDGSVVLLEPASGRVSVRAEAVLRALAHASPRWRWLGAVAARPTLVRMLDVLYGFVARHRDEWFGRHDTCALPDASFRARFID